MGLLDTNLVSALRRRARATPFVCGRGCIANLIKDAMIAGIALVLTVVTRNVRDFARLGAPIFDPFAPPGRAGT
jgi:predicted nucleic acid-binding protein